MFGEYAVFSELAKGNILIYDRIEKEPYTAVLNELLFRSSKNSLQNYLIEVQKNKK